MMKNRKNMERDIVTNNPENSEQDSVMPQAVTRMNIERPDSASISGPQEFDFNVPKTIVITEMSKKIHFFEEVTGLVEFAVEGVFDEVMADRFERHVQRAIQGDQNIIIIRINSPGGSVYALNRMLNTLEVAKARKIICATVCSGIAMSCGAILLGMGTLGHRYCGEHGVVLLHEISGGVQGSQTAMLNELNEYGYDNASLFRKIAKNANLTDLDYYRKFVTDKHRDLYIHPARAKYIKVVDHIGIPTVLKNVTVEYKIVPRGNDLSDEALKELMAEEAKLQEKSPFDVLASVQAPEVNPPRLNATAQKPRSDHINIAALSVGTSGINEEVSLAGQLLANMNHSSSPKNVTQNKTDRKPLY